jgi:hypothetical protein
VSYEEERETNKSKGSQYASRMASYKEVHFYKAGLYVVMLGTGTGRRVVCLMIVYMIYKIREGREHRGTKPKVRKCIESESFQNTM